MQSQLQVPITGPAGGGTYPLPVTSDQPNWLSANSLWVTISPQAGSFKVAENRVLYPQNAFSAADQNAYKYISSTSYWIYTSRNKWELALMLSRTNARGTEAMGGL